MYRLLGMQNMGFCVGNAGNGRCCERQKNGATRSDSGYFRHT